MTSPAVESLVVESVLRSLLMAAMVWVGIKLLRVSHVLAQKIAWGLVLLVAFAMPFLMRWQAAHPAMALSVPVKQMPAVAAFEKSVASMQSDSSRSTTVYSVPATSAVPVVTMNAAPSSSASVWHLRDLVRFVIPVYLVISGALLLRLLLGLAMAMRIWYRAEPASPILEPRATVRISSMIQSPVTIGSGIVLPANYTEWDRAKLRLVLAHERSHVHQGDFYLQLLASFYAALVWFSPLGWWLKRRLAELGEAISDRAALLEADDHSSYAAVLLEFAAMPRQGFAGVTAGVGMARSSNIQRRIELILNDGRFRRAFVSGRRHAVIAALLVPCGVVVATSLLHVQAAEVVKANAIAILQPAQEAVQEPVTAAATASIAPSPIVLARPALETKVLAAIARVDAAPPVVLADEARADAVQVSVNNAQDFEFDGSFAIVDGDKSSVTIDHRGSMTTGSAGDGSELDRARSRIHGSFILFEHDGKPYVITDQALVEKSMALYTPQSELGRRQAELGKQQAQLGKQEGLLAQQQAWVKVPIPDISKEMAELQKTVNALATEKTQEITQERLGELQAKLGAMQGRLAEAQALAGSKQAILGSQQGDFGAKQAELGRQQAELGREQARIAREASQQIRSLIDQAVREGKAKPLE
jgi:beta-lactamase regulating signal transducer with metallopeptidase domain